MKERPILFSAPMVRAILDGRKTQTRRIVKPQPHTTTTAFRDIPDTCYWYGAIHTENDFGIEFHPDPAHGDWKWKCPYGAPGDRLWVRETHYVQSAGYKDGSGTLILYRATEPNAPNTWTPSIHMPRWASRITLEITDVRVQRVQEISHRDSVAEGVGDSPFAETAFARLWESINAKKYPWASNPWVWAITFRRIDLPA